MSKTINFGFYTIKAIHKKEDKQEKDLTSLLKAIEQKPLNIEKSNHRYIILSNENIITISLFQYIHDGIILRLRKCIHKDIKGSFLGDGDCEYNVNHTLNSKFNRQDSTIIEESFAKIFNNGIMIFQLNKNSLTTNQFKYYLEEFITEYEFEILPVYKDDLFEQLENGNIKEVSLKIGFSPKGSLFTPESYSGATKVDIIFKKSRSKNFLNFKYFKELLIGRKTSKLGILDQGEIQGANISLDGDSSPIKLDAYELREKQIFKDRDDAHQKMLKNDVFDSLLQKHNDFLKEYLARDTRYD